MERASKSSVDADIKADKKRAPHDWFNFSLVFLNVLTFVALLFFNAASSIPKLS